MKQTHSIVGLLLGLVVACQASAPEQSAPARPTAEKLYMYNYDVRDLVVYETGGMQLDDETEPIDRPLKVSGESLEVSALQLAQMQPSWSTECEIYCANTHLCVFGPEQLHATVSVFLAGARTIDDWSATRKDAPGSAR